MIYVKLEITKVRSRVSDSANAMQMQEFEFYDSTNVKIQPTSISATLQSTSSSEDILKLIDGDSNTKFCTTQWGSSVNGSCVITFTFDNLFNINDIHHYRYMTGNDSDSRDPVSWGIKVSKDGSTFITTASVSDASIPTSRKQYTDDFNFFGGFTWKMTPDKKIININFLEPAEHVMMNPYPDSIWQSKENDTPEIPIFNEPPERIFDKQYPNSVWYLKDGSFKMGIIKQAEEYAMKRTYPDAIWRMDLLYGPINLLLDTDFLEIKSVWHIVDGRPIHPLFLTPAASPMEAPYPYALWRVPMDDDITNLLLDDAEIIIDPVPEDDPEIYKDPNRDNYENIINKPTINGREISINNTFDELGIKEMTHDMINELILETFNVLL